ncbi:FaeA/PapI family transcriptional regulator [Enterobacter sp. 22325]|uniref:FaeA/PapI family transcriptional regulator n=1 Tax=Enterobacter sp. 22325 TaxID=3453911 RepID=UPI003F83C07A
MSSEDLHQECLAFLYSYNDCPSGCTTREIANYLNISVYQARLVLLKLKEDGLVSELPRNKPSRGAALHWVRTR